MKIDNSVKIAGAYRAVVTRADGSVKFDSGEQKNIVLENYMICLCADGGAYPTNTSGNTTTSYPDVNELAIAIGSGTVAPTRSDYKLAAQVTTSGDGGEPQLTSTEQPNTEHPNHIKYGFTKSSTWTNLNNQNLAEVGLLADRVLITRALLKDIDGNPTVITVLQGETLTITYTVYIYIDIRRTSGEIVLSTTKDNITTTDTFEYIAIPWFNNNYKMSWWSGIEPLSLTAWGVLEPDDELDASWNINKSPIAEMTHATSPINLTGYANSASKSANSSEPNYLSDIYVQHAWGARSCAEHFVSNTYNLGLNACNFDNGIRCIWVDVAGRTQQLVPIFVAFKNKANGQGIKKTNRHRLLFEFRTNFGWWD